MSISVDLSLLESISHKLHTAAVDLDSTGGSSPAAVDAGEATAVISSMLSRIAESAGGLAEGVALAGQEVLNTSSSYWNADDAASRGFQPPSRTAE